MVRAGSGCLVAVCATLVGCDAATTPPAQNDERIFLNEAPLGIDFAPNGDLIVGTETTLRRLALDGSEIWRVSLDHGASSRSTAWLRTSSQGLIVFTRPGGPFAAYRDNGTLAWTAGSAGSGILFMSDVEMGPDDQAFVVDLYGQIHEVPSGRLVGNPRASTYPAGDLAVDSSGLVACLQHRDSLTSAIYRFDATGELSTWHLPTYIRRIMFDPNDQLVGASDDGYSRFDQAGNVTSIISAGQRTGFDLHDSGFFEWVHDWETYELVVRALDESAAPIWQIEKTQVWAIFGACDGARHCALAGNSRGAPPETAYWLEVFDVLSASRAR